MTPNPHKQSYYILSLNIQYQSIESLYKSIYKLFQLFKQKNSFHYEQDLDKMFLYSHDFVTSMTFDKTRIKSLSEKSQLSGREFRVKQIIPMVQVEGILYLTNKRVYFQPVHTGIYGSANTVVNFKLKEITQLFKRRYKLMNIGLEFRVKDQEKTMYITFTDSEERDALYDAMRGLVTEGCVTAE